MFYTFRQNNSFGSFDEPAVNVIIEASTSEEANSIAIEKGLYFDGVDNDKDCECCGDRWYPVSENDGKNEPLIYGKPPAEEDDYIIYRKDTKS